MPFKQPFNSYYEKVYVPAIKQAGLQPMRADEIFRAGSVTRDIWECVVGSKIIVAELTERNANVFYELGLAHAIGRPAVLVTQNMDDVPFDLRHLRILEYNTIDADWAMVFQEQLKKAIEATLADPTGALAFPLAEPASPQKKQGKSTTDQTSKSAQGQREAPEKSDISSAFAFEMFSALPSESKVRLMELAMKGEEISQEDITAILLEAMRASSPEKKQSRVQLPRV